MDEQPNGIDQEVSKLTGFEPVIASAYEQSIESLNDKHISIRGVFISRSLPGMNWLSVIREFHRIRPGVPIFLIGENDSEDVLLKIDETDFSGLGIKGAIPRPINFLKMVEMIEPLTLGAEAEASMIVSELFKEDEGDYIAVRADSFLNASQSLFDVYIKVSEQKLFKVCSRGSKFDELRISNYIEKGITHFHLKRESQFQFLKYCEYLTQKTVESRSSVDVKIEQTKRFGEETLQFFTDYGISPEDIQFANTFSQSVQKVFSEFNPNKQPVLSGFLNDLSGYEHGVASAMLTGLLSIKVGSGHNTEPEKLGLAALLHDFALAGESPIMKGEDETKMSLKEKTIFRKHPEVGAKYLAQIRGISPEVIRAVHHHHVRQDQTGFPMQINFSDVGTNAQLIGIADEFLHLLDLSRTNPQINPFAELARKSFAGFSDHIVQAFKDTFNQSF